MNQIERFYKIDQILNDRGVASFPLIMSELEVSRATLTRDLAYLRDRFNAPIIHDRDAGGYRFDRTTKQIGKQYELPGLWFSAEEIHALLTMQHLLANLDTGGLLGPHIKPLLSRLTALIGVADNPAEEVVKRIRILTVGARQVHLDNFQSVGSALLRLEEQEQWMIRKGKLHGFELSRSASFDLSESLPVRCDVHESHEQMLSGKQHSGNGIRIFSVLFDGVLTVVEPGAFSKAIDSGIGHGKALGLGLLSVVPAS